MLENCQMEPPKKVVQIARKWPVVYGESPRTMARPHPQPACGAGAIGGKVYVETDADWWPTNALPTGGAGKPGRNKI